MSMFTTSLEDHLLPDNKTMDEVFEVDGNEQWIGRTNMCTINNGFTDY